MKEEKKKQEKKKKQIKSSCEMCEYYLYDDEYDYYYCDMDLDEDEMYDFITGNIGDCHYFRYRNEYRYVNKQI